ncbi:MAG: hypothetical protein M3367_03595 [Acidobacteriota bacterium]|nr:hypothetical protein [Acidobacteriota bacterium]
MKLQTKQPTTHKDFTFGLSITLLILLFVVACSLVQAQTTQNDIVFQSSRDGNSEIYAIKADGSGQTNLTNSAEGESFPDWSPDGSNQTRLTTEVGNLELN